MLSRAAAAGLAGLGLALLLSWLAALAMNHDVLPGSDVRLAALVCCGLACLAAGALSPRPEQGEGTWRSDDMGGVGDRISHPEGGRWRAGFLRRYRHDAADRAGCCDRRFVHFS